MAKVREGLVKVREGLVKVREGLVKRGLLKLLSFKELHRLREDMVGKESGSGGHVGWSWDISLL